MAIAVERLHHTYQPNTPMAKQVLFGVDLQIRDGEVLGIIGPSKAGKSTLIQYLNGLFRPVQGAGLVMIHGVDTREKGAAIGRIRSTVGMVFQFPEDQLFEPSIEQDVAFGPRNMGLPEDEVMRRVKWALSLVGLPHEQFGQRHTWALSGGQKRRVAIAGVLAMQPRTLIFDEPTAGLDPRGREDLLSLIQQLHRELGVTVIIVSNNLEEVARLAQRVIVLKEGKVAVVGTPREVFGHPERLHRLGLPTLKTVAFMERLAENHLPISVQCLTVDEICDDLLRVLQSKGHQAVVNGR